MTILGTLVTGLETEQDLEEGRVFSGTLDLSENGLVLVVPPIGLGASTLLLVELSLGLFVDEVVNSLGTLVDGMDPLGLGP